MDFLGIGPLELVLIAILGLLFFGPEKLPGMAAKAARMYQNFRKTTYELTKNISEEVNTEIKREETELKSLVDTEQFDLSKLDSDKAVKPPAADSEKAPDE